MVEQFRDFDTEPVKVASKGCGIGCLSFVGVGMFIGLLGASLAVSCSTRVPFTETNLSAIAAIGDKNQTIAVIPSYIENRNREDSVIDGQTEVLVGTLRWKNVVTVGKQPDSPLLEMFLALKGREGQPGLYPGFYGYRQAVITIPDGDKQVEK